MAKRYPQIYASIGIHPNDVTDNWQDDIEQLVTFLNNKEELKIIAIGECGFDKHSPEYNLPRQIESFKKQIELSLEYDLPLIIHTRDSQPETLEVLKNYKGLRGSIHCFSEDLKFAQAVITSGFVLSIGGTITYPRNNQLREVVKTVGLDHIILETDAPFLPPQTMRGEKNHPKYIKTIAEYLANFLEIPFEEVAEKTTYNAQRLFHFVD